MLRRRVYRSIGLALVVAAIGGLLVSLAGIVGVWRVMRSMKTGLATTLDLAGTTLQTTSEAMTIAGGALDQAGRYRAVLSLHGTKFYHESAQFYGWCTTR